MILGYLRLVGNSQVGDRNETVWKVGGLLIVCYGARRVSARVLKLRYALEILEITNIARLNP